MLANQQVEQLVSMIGVMERTDLVHHFHAYPTRFPVDFSEEFLRTASVERLRHIFLALCLQNQRMPLQAAA